MMRALYIFFFSLLLASQSLWAQAPSSDGDESSVFLYGVTVSTDYDDQIVPVDGSSASGDVIYSLQPQFGFKLTRSRWQSSLDYLPAVTYSSQRRSSYDLISHSLGFAFKRRVTKRLSFEVQNNFTLTNNPFDNVRASSEVQEFGALDRPNSTITGTVLSRRMEQVGTTLAYSLSKRTTVGVGGNFMQSDYRQNPQSAFDQSRRSVAESGDAFFSRQLGPRASMGFRYRYQKIDFGHGTAKTDSQSLLYSWDMAFTPKVSLSLFAGPDYSDTRSQSPDMSVSPAVRSVQWSGVGGATLGWNGERHGFSAGATRQISDGGGTRGNVRLDSFNIKANRQISRRSSMSAFAIYNRNHLLVPVAGSSSSFDYLAGGAEFSREITEHTSVGLFYMRVQQNGDQSLSSSASGNRVGIRVSYHNQRPIGR